MSHFSSSDMQSESDSDDDKTMPGLKRWGVSGPHDGITRVALITTIILLIFGVAMRAWIVLSPFGRADSDESVVGLMARDILEGDFSAYFWGQPYGGSLEAMVASGLFAVFGIKIFALKLSTILLNAGATYVLWRVARRLVSPSSAAITAGVFWASPFAYVWLSTKERGFYESSLFCGLLVVLFVLQMIERPQLRTAFFGGIAGGLALWSSPQSMYLIIPAVLVLLLRRPGSLTSAWPAISGFVLGFLPALVYNVRNDWKSLDSPPMPGHQSTYLERLGGFFTEGIPLATGAKIPYIGDWVLPVVGPLLIVLAVYAFIHGCVAWWKWRGDRPAVLDFALIMTVLYPFIFAISPYSWFVGDGRYISFLWAPLAMLVVFASRRAREVVAVLLAALTVVSMVSLLRWHGLSYSHDLYTEDLRPLIHYLDRNDVRHAYGDYWIAYRVNLETDYRRTVSPAWMHRNEEIKANVENSTENTVYIAFKDSTEDKAFAQRAQDWQTNPERTTVGEFSVYTFHSDLPAEHVYDLAGY